MNIVKNLGGNQGYLSIDIIKIISVPHVSILVDGDKMSEKVDLAIQREKLDMQGMLYELYEQYKQRLYETSLNQNEAIELLWLSRPVSNQRYRAAVDLYVIIRTQQATAQAAKAVSKSLMDACRSTMLLDHYEVEENNNHELSSFEEFQQLWQGVDNQAIKAVVKTERLENLQNTMLPVCYAYDTIPTSASDLSRLVASITSMPHSAVSLQLIPVFFKEPERQELTMKVQTLKTISGGISMQGGSTVRIEAAARAATSYCYYDDNAEQPLFLFNIIAYTAQENAPRLASSIMGQLNAGQTRMAGFNVATLPSELRPTSAFPLQPWLVNDWLMKNARPKAIWNNGQFVSSAMWRMPFVITSEEASQFFRLPIGSDTIGAGLNVNETGHRSRSYAPGVLNQSALPLGVIKGSAGNDTIGLGCKDLAKHMLIVGTPGSGKTTFCVGLLDRLWKEHHIPFLVIEPAKNEYRALLKSIPDLQVFTPGKHHVSPFVFNPFVPPSGVKLEAYKSVLKTAFAAGVTMTSPLDKIFEDSVNNCYSDFRWLDSYTSEDKGRVFNIADFIKCFRQTFDAIGYKGDSQNIGRAGIVRLQSLASLFDNYYSIPIKDILSRPTVIELAAIENSEQKALIIALLLLSILSYVNANFKGGEGEDSLKNFILLEEAHVLLDASPNVVPGAADPTAIAQSLVKRMLAEIRSYGVGVGIADQSPRKVGIDIVALTDIKIAFRLVEASDRQILADSSSMDNVQAARLARLKPGTAYLFFNKLEEPEEIVTPNYRHENNIDISLTDEGVRKMSTYWNDKQDKLRPYPECRLCPYCQDKCDYARRLLSREIARRLFRAYNPQPDKNMDELRKSFGDVDKRLKERVMKELNDEPYSDQLLACVRVHLYRKVNNESRLKLTDKFLKDRISQCTS